MTDEPDYYANDAKPTFDAHLFEVAEVENAGGTDGEKSDRPASSLCSRTTAYGPFHEVEGDDVDDDLPENDGDLCGACRRIHESNGGEDA